jgi:subfamily B ATP-binding cassette protein MsbA
MAILMKRIKQIGRLALPYWRLGLMIIALMIISTALSLSSPMLVKLLIDGVLIDGNRGLLNWLAVIFMLVYLVGSFLQMATSYTYNFLGQRLLLDIRHMLYEHIEHLSPSFFSKNKTGDIIQRLYGDVAQIQSLVSTRVIGILTNVIMSIGIIFMLLMLDFKLTLFTLIVFPFFGLSSIYFAKKIRVRERIVREKSGELLSFFQETISLMPVIQSFVREKSEARRHLKKSREIINLALAGTLLYSSSGLISGFLATAATTFVYWYGGHSIFEGTMTLGGLVAYSTYVGKLFGPITSLVGQNQGIQAALVSIERVFEFLDIKPEVKDASNAVDLKFPRGEITFDQVSFSYDGKTPTLSDISFQIKPGESVALVGGSGSGKSTIANLLLRFYDPTKGGIRMDGRDLRKIRLSNLREHIGVVSQDVTLFNTSIAENILYGRRGASSDEVIASAYLANIGQFIEENLPDRFETVVGEKGARLSGGQKQRISIARVILKNPRVLILDEATSALDSESEKVVQSVLDYLMKGRTTLVIAHRFSTIKNVDRIIVLDRGRIAEMGTHEKLYQAGGLYRQLYDTQFNVDEQAA